MHFLGRNQWNSYAVSLVNGGGYKNLARTRHMGW